MDAHCLTQTHSICVRRMFQRSLLVPQGSRFLSKVEAYNSVSDLIPTHASRKDLKRSSLVDTRKKSTLLEDFEFVSMPNITFYAKCFNHGQRQPLTIG